MQVTNNFTSAVYNRYQSGRLDGMSYSEFNNMLHSISPNGSYTSPEGQVWADYLDWKATQPPRDLPGSQGATEENIAYLEEHFSGSLNIFQRVDALDIMVEMGIMTKEQMFAAIGFKPLELVPVGDQMIVAAGTPEQAMAGIVSDFAEGWKGFFTGAPIMQSDNLEELFKLLDEQLENSKDKDAAQEIKDVLEQVARKSFGANWAVV